MKFFKLFSEEKNKADGRDEADLNEGSYCLLFGSRAVNKSHNNIVFKSIWFLTSFA